MTSKLISKTSILIFFSIAFSMLMPIVSYAAPLMEIIYRPASESVYETNIHGYIYTKDPSSVSVSANFSDNSVTQFTYNWGNSYSGFYDDNNTEYYYLNYSFGDPTMMQAPTSLSVDLEGSKYTLAGTPYTHGAPGEYHYTSSLTDDFLSSYRMPGQFLTSVTQATYYLPAGSDIVSFTPNNIGSLGEGIIIQLPYNNSVSTTFNRDAMDFGVRDFEIIDQSVSSSVYYKGYSYSTSGELTFNLDQKLVQGHQYLVKLSSTSSGNEIMLPSDGIYTAFVKIGFWGNGYPPSGPMEDYNSVYFRNLTIGNPTDVSTDPPITTDPPVTTIPPVTTDPPVISNPPTGSPSTPTSPSNPVQEIVNDTSLKNGTKDKVTVDIADGTKQVLLPANASATVGDRKLELANDKLSLEIPQGVLKKLQSLVPADQLAGANISLRINPVSESDTAQLLIKASGKKKLKLKATGDVYNFTLSVITADGTEKVLSQFDQPITIRLKVPSDVNPALLGIYYIADDGKLEYVGGQMTDGEIVAEVHHFSTYAALEYAVTFDDVSEHYWASDVIKELAAKQIVSGVNESTFAPMQQMTRAEFATLIARTLNLTAANAAVFTDVDSASVHAGTIAAVNEAGIILGRSAATFAPDDYITREEMAAMIIRAYEYKTGRKAEPAAAYAYSDRESAAKWSIPYIDAASGIGFMKGRGNATFAPKQFMTRAEGAQVIYLLLKSN